MDKVQTISSESNAVADTRLQYLLVCATELTSTEVISGGGVTAEKCASYFIQQCLQMHVQRVTSSLAPWSSKQRDYLLQCLFDGQKSFVDTKTMY